MADFEAQVNGITNLSIGSGSTHPSRDELSQFLKDAVMDVTSKSIDTDPSSAKSFIAESSETTSNSSLDLNGARIISVIRESGVNNAWRECTEITPDLQYEVTDVDSLHYASAFNPVYMIENDGAISVFPAPGSDPNAFKVYYVNNAPQNKSGTALIYSHSEIKYFDDSQVYLVVIYAAIKSLEAKLASYTIDDEDTELVESFNTNLESLKKQYKEAFTVQQAQTGRAPTRRG